MIRALGLAVAFLAALDASPAAAHGGAADGTPAFFADPAAMAVIAVFAATYALGWHRLARATGRYPGRTQAAAFYAGCALVLLALASPLDRAADALLSLHMVQHLVLVTAAPLLVVIGRPDLAFAAIMPKASAHAARRLAHMALSRPILATIVHGLAVWAWHAPPLFEAAVTNPGVHALEHLSFLVTALWFWGALIASARSASRRLSAVVGVLATMIHSGLLGAILTFAPRLLYLVYEDDALLLSVEPLGDQQLAGLIMWVPGGAIYLAAALWVAALLMKMPSHNRGGRLNVLSATSIGLIAEEVWKRPSKRPF